MQTTDDGVLDGRLRLRQPARGHRVGHDAILLAAATGAKPGDHAVELGAGVGAAGLALARRIEGLRVTLVEIDPALAALAADNAQRNGLGDRVTSVVLDVTAPARAYVDAGLPPSSAARVLMNPPFNDAARQKASPDPDRRAAHVAPPKTLATWLRAASRLLAAHGALTMIWRADGLAEVLHALEGGFGDIAVMPVHAREDTPAIRVLMRAVKGSHAPLALYPALILNDSQGKPTDAAEAILRKGEVLPLAAL
jgi:tRNA1(Val) A37 N6-methylase TrmN6